MKLGVSLGLSLPRSKFGASQAVPLPFDSYTADLAVAWSAARRLLSSYTGPLIRVRRTSDDTESDVAYDASGELDTVALLAFCGAGDGFIRTYYDQSGNARHMEQATNAEQIRIVASGVTDTLGTNTKPCGRCGTDLTGGYTQASVFTTYSGTTISINAVHLIENTQTGAGVLGAAKDAGGTSGAGANAIARSAATSNLRSIKATLTAAITYGAPFSAYMRHTGTDVVLKASGASGSSAYSTAFDINRVIMGGGSAAVQTMGAGHKHAEGAVWLADLGQVAMDAIQTNQTAYFGL